MIKATLKEKYISREDGIAYGQRKEIVHETRLFSSEQKLEDWLQTFRHQLWQDDPAKVKLVEGIFVDTQVVEVDDVAPPRKTCQYATFRQGVSYYYANDEEKSSVTAV